MKGKKMDSSELMRIALEAALAGGRVVRERFGQGGLVTMKADVEEQTHTDLESEQAIVRVIRDRFPGHLVRSEELGVLEGDNDKVWVIDPLDGTSNFVLGIPQVAVCVSFVRDNDIQLTVIYQPILDLTYTAVKGEGAWINGERLVASSADISIGQAAIAGVVTFETKQEQRTRQIMNALYSRCRRLLDNWAPSLDWCLLASGKAAALVYVSHQPLTDDPGMLAGSFLFREAGGQFRALSGESSDIAEATSVVATASASLMGELSSAIADSENGLYS